jgi:hypothetical protein
LVLPVFSWLSWVSLSVGSSPLSCGVFLLLPLLQVFLLLITGQCYCSYQPLCLFTAHVGGGSSNLSCGVFLPLPLSQSFLLLVAGHMTGSRRSLSGMPGLFIYSSGKDSLPLSLVLSVPHPPSHMFILFLLLITQFVFYPWVVVNLSRGLCCSGQALSVRVPCTAKLTLSASSQAIWVWATGGLGVLLVSPFNVKCTHSAQAGGVEGSKFCLFSVILIARCVSSVTPRFHYRRHAFYRWWPLSSHHLGILSDIL